MTAPLSLAVEGPVATLTLDRPPVNAIGIATVDALEAALDEIEALPDLAALRVRAEGRTFSAGADLKEIAGWAADAAGAEAMTAWLRRLNAALDRLAVLPMLTIAEISGPALGGGLELALACDLRLAAEGATLGLPEVKVGLIPGGGGTQRLTTLCGAGFAKRLILTGETVGAGEALAAGLVQWVVPAGALGAEAERIASGAARMPGSALAAAKACVAIARPSTSATGTAAEIAAVVRLLGSSDSRAALGRFTGRPPAG